MRAFGRHFFGASDLWVSSPAPAYPASRDPVPPVPSLAAAVLSFVVQAQAIQGRKETVTSIQNNA